MICVVIDAAVGVVDVVIVAIIAVITAVVTAVMAAVATADAVGAADAAGAGAPTRMTGIITGGRYGTRVQARGARLTAQVLTKDTEWDLKTEGGIGVLSTDKTGGRVPPFALEFCVENVPGGRRRRSCRIARTGLKGDEELVL